MSRLLTLRKNITQLVAKPTTFTKTGHLNRGVDEHRLYGVGRLSGYLLGCEDVIVAVKRAP